MIAPSLQFCTVPSYRVMAPVNKMSLHDTALSNGLQMPTVGLGTWRIRGAEETAFAVEKALGAGYRLIDTAAMYENEADIGAALKKLNVDRKSVFITSKLMSRDQGWKDRCQLAVTIYTVILQMGIHILIFS